MEALHNSLGALFSELVDGASQEAFMLNGGDKGLLRSLDGLSAAQASAAPASGGASIAAHVAHVRYGLELMNRWAAGDPNPWASADWTASWRRTTVDDRQWAALRDQLKDHARRWHEALTTPRDLSALELNGMIGSVGHLAYHLGAIRQIDRSLRGPQAS